MVMKNKILTGLITFLLFLSPFFYVSVLQDPSTLPRYALLAGIVGISLIILGYSFVRSVAKIYHSPVMLLAISYVFLAGISSFWAVEPSNNIVYTTQLLSLFFLFFIVMQITSVSVIRLFLYVSLFSAAITALVGLAQNYNLNVFDLRGPKMGGTFGYKNHMALYLDLIIPVGLFLVITSTNKYLKWLSLFAFVMCFYYIIASHTRGSYVALVVVVIFLAVVVFIFADVRRAIAALLIKHRCFFIFAIILILASFYSPDKTEYLTNRPAYKQDTIDTSTRDRLTAYSNSIYLIRENIFLGSGYGTFWKAFRPYNNNPNVMLRSDENVVMYRLHSDPLQVVVELGIVGGVLFVSIFLWTYVIGIRLLSGKIEATAKLLVVGMLLGLSASLVHSLVDFPFLKPSSAIQIWLYLGLINGLYAKYFGSYIVLASKLIKVLIFVLSVFVTVASSLFFRSFLLGNYYFRLAEVSANNRQCTEATRYIDKSVATFKHDFFSHKMRVNFHISCTRDPQTLYTVLTDELSWDNTNTMALKWRGYLYLNAGKLIQADQDFKRLSYLLPHRASGVIGEAFVLFESGMYQQAKNRLIEFDKNYPGNKDIERALKRITESKKRMKPKP